MPYDRVPKEPERLSSYLQSQGGIRDEGGELANLLDGTSRPGLRNAAGMPLDEAAFLAWEEGFLPSDAETIGNGQPTTSALLEALDRDLRGNPVYREQDEFAGAQHREALERNSEIDRLAQEHDLPTRGLTQDEFYRRLAEKLGPQQTAAEAERLAASHVEIMRQAAEEGWLPDFGEGTPSTPEELENAYRQEVAARRAAESAYGIGEREALARPGVADETGGRPGRGGAGAGRRAEPAEPGLELTAEDKRAPLDRLQDEIATLEGELAHAKEAGFLSPEQIATLDGELAAADQIAADAESMARAIERGGMCLARRL